MSDTTDATATAPETGGENLATVLGAFLEAQRHGRIDALQALLTDDVVWEGPVPGTRCNSRREALGLLGRRFAPGNSLRITRLEAREIGDRVALAAQGPDFHPGGEAGPAGELYLVFTLREGRVVHMRGTATREEAFGAGT